MNVDAKGQRIPNWARYTDDIAAAGSSAGYKNVSGRYIPFGLYLNADSTITYTTVDNETPVTFLFKAGYHPISFATITSTSAAALMLFPFDPTL